MKEQALVELALGAGFTHAAVADAGILNPRQEVRDMCIANTCRRYNSCWAGPPACGTPEECMERLRRYDTVLLVQNVGQLEDSLDFEGIQETRQHFEDALRALLPQMRERYPDVLPLGAGCCSLCKDCTYPDAPCRFPEKAIASMEAYGLLVNEVCTDGGLKYNYGPNTLAFTGCFLFHRA